MNRIVPSGITSIVAVSRARMWRVWALPWALALGIGGCAPPPTNDVAPTPPATVSPSAPEESKATTSASADAPKDKDKDKPAEPTKDRVPTPAPKDQDKDKDKAKSKPDEGKGGDDAAAGSDEPQSDAADGVALIPVKYDEMLKKIAAK